jgi:signal transduction histidine kinase
VFELRPPALDADGLAATVRKHLEVVGRANDLRIDVTVVGTDDALSSNVEHELFRIVQEAATNAVRHAHANALRVALELGPDRAVVTVADDGVGFDAGERRIRSRRLGLTSMRERAQALGGTFAIDSAPGAGTTIRVEVPV